MQTLLVVSRFKRAISASAVATYVLCPLRARHGNAAFEARLEEDTFAASVRRALQYASETRSVKEPYDLAFVVRKVLVQYGCGGDAALFERAQTVARFGLRLLSSFEPVGVDVRYSKTIAGVGVKGTIELVMRDERGPLVLAIKTGAIPGATFAIELALARACTAHELADATFAIVAINEEGATLREPVLPDARVLDRYVRDTFEATEVEPRPGAYCASCPFLSLCPAGRAAVLR